MPGAVVLWLGVVALVATAVGCTSPAPADVVDGEGGVGGAGGGCNATQLQLGYFLCGGGGGRGGGGGGGGGGGQCVAAAALCDGIADCPEADDESVALCGCLPNEFRCSNSCVALVRRCDRREDCPDGADERGCETFVCPSTHFKCSNHFCVPEDKTCNFEDDCGDGSDELTCTNRECWKKEFACDNGECIRPGFVCDGLRDCHDGSDELHCSEEDFVDCADGTRVHRQYWCDDWPECQDNHADELNCSECKGHDEFRCPNGRCIRLANVCDSQCDCVPTEPLGSCADEIGCQDYYKDIHGVTLCAEARTLTCAMPEGRSRAHARCLQPRFLCDGRSDCLNGLDASDELGCPATVGSLLEDDVVQCRENRTLPSIVLCDYKRDCLFGEDEYNCNINCRAGMYQCDNGQCIDASLQCDLQFDCWDKSDELHCENFKCQQGMRKCLKTKQCVRDELWCDYHLDCPDGSDETYCQRKEICAENEFTCSNGQCIPANLRCYISGKMREGCADGSHLQGCAKWDCSAASFKCRNGPCLNTSLVCNSQIDCPDTWSDEDGCVFQCSELEPRCQCQDRKANCSGLGLYTIPDIEKAINRYFLGDNFLSNLAENSFSHLDRLVYLNLRNNSIVWLPPMVFDKLWRLATLDLSDNNIHTIGNNTFYGLSSLTGLHLEGNGIQVLESMAFYGLSALTTLDLRHQKICNISSGAFIGLRKLMGLLLSYNAITYLVDGTFTGLPALHSLDLSNNNIKIIGSNVFRSTTSLNKLTTDEFRFCCLARHVAECYPPPDEFSSCEDLMSNLVLRICVWVLGVTATVGNALVIAWRMRFKHTNQVHSFLITNLAIGDLFMGSYLLIIASVDARYRGVYFIHDSSWRSSELCSLAGFISTFSSELSVFTLTVITLDRFLVIIFPFRVRRLEMPKTRLVMAAGWLGAALLSGLPLLQFDYFRNFYGRSGVCLALHITPEKPNGWEYSVFVFLFLNLISFSIIALGYVWMYAVARTTRQAVCNKEQRPSDAAMARRMTLIVATDAACWMPIILLGVLSLGGITVPPEVFAWVAVFVLPLNAAVNPVLYTISTAPFLGPARRSLRTFKRSCKLSLTADQRRTYSSSLGSTCAHSRYDADNAVANNLYVKVSDGKHLHAPVMDKDDEMELEQTTLFALTKQNQRNSHKWQSESYHNRSSTVTRAPILGRANSCHQTIDTAISARGEIILLKRLSSDRRSK